MSILTKIFARFRRPAAPAATTPRVAGSLARWRRLGARFVSNEPLDFGAWCARERRKAARLREQREWQDELRRWHADDWERW